MKNHTAAILIFEFEDLKQAAIKNNTSIVSRICKKFKWWKEKKTFNLMIDNDNLPANMQTDDD